MRIGRPDVLGIATIMGKELRSRMHGWRAALMVSVYLAVLAGLALLFIELQVSQMQYSGGYQWTFGSQVFVVLAGFQLLLVIFIAPGLTAGAIAGERERQTLDLLLCTRLSSFVIVLGKLLASLSFALLLLVASLPLFSVAFLLGGVSPRQLGLVFLICAATGLTIGSLALFISSLMSRGQWATVFAYAATFLLVFGLGLAAVLVGMITRSNPLQMAWFAYFNPLAALASALLPTAATSAGLPAPPRPLWQYHLAIDAVLIVVLLLASAAATRPQALRLLRRRGGS